MLLCLPLLVVVDHSVIVLLCVVVSTPVKSVAGAAGDWDEVRRREQRTGKRSQ